MSAGSVPTLTATGAVLSAQDVKLAQVRIHQPEGVTWTVDQKGPILACAM
jgi:hypothetical protein